MAQKEVGVAVLGWGTVDETWGYAENVNVDDESEKENIQNGAGDTKGVIYSDIRQKVSADYTPLAAAQATDGPNLSLSDLIGKEFTIKTMASETIAFLVDGASKKYSKGKVVTWSVNGYFYPEVTVGA